jgi:hypothetical protein
MSVLSFTKTSVNHDCMTALLQPSTRQKLERSLDSEPMKTNRTRHDNIAVLHVRRSKSPKSSGQEKCVFINCREAFLPPSSRGHAEDSVVKQRVNSEYARPNRHCENAKTPGGIQLQ